MAVGFVSALGSFAPPRGVYLDWVKQEFRDLVIDPDTLPTYSPKLRILWLTDTLGLGGAEKLAEISGRIVTRVGHSCVVWSLQAPATGAWAGDFGGAKVLTGCLDEAVGFVRGAGVQVVVCNNGAGCDATQRFIDAGAIVLVLPFGLTGWNLKKLGALSRIKDHCAIIGYPTIGAGLLQQGHALPAYSCLGPIDVRDFPFTKRVLKPPFKLLYCGRMSWEKNLAGIVEVFDRVRAQVPAELHVVGGVDPSSPANFHKAWQQNHDEFRAHPLFKKHKAAGAIIEYGYVREFERIVEIMSAMHVNFLTSDFEGEPVTMLESMALGTVCAGRRMTEVGPLLDGCGILTEPEYERMPSDEIDAMADGIVEVLQAGTAKYARLARAGRERIERYHAADAWVDKFERIVGDVLRRNAAKPAVVAPRKPVAPCEP